MPIAAGNNRNHNLLNRLYQGRVKNIRADIDTQIKSGERGWLACLNVYSYVLCENDMRFSQALKNANYLVADGVGVEWGAKVLGVDQIARITGYDVFCSVNSLANETGLRVFFLGSTNCVLKKIIERYKQDYPSAEVVGYYCPPYYDDFPSDELSKIGAVINKTDPDVVWVGLSAPKQEVIIAAIFSETRFRFAAGIGAVFDFYSGVSKRAPSMIQRVGLEWVFRFILNPQKMIVRVRTIPVFCKIIVMWVIEKKIKRQP
jgi:N-acetylglucosaminyldiphosphoundecaprenol N-acetyl-beta-D-mannosaminyltransferase